MMTMKEIEEFYRIKEERLAKAKADAEPLRVEAERLRNIYEDVDGDDYKAFAWALWQMKVEEYNDAMRQYYDIMAEVA